MPNLFDKAKKKAPKTSKATTAKREVIIKGMDKDFDDIIKLKEEVDTKSAKIKTLHKSILDKGRENYLSIYEKEQKNPGSFNLATPAGHSVLVVPMER